MEEALCSECGSPEFPRRFVREAVLFSRVTLLRLTRPVHLHHPLSENQLLVQNLGPEKDKWMVPNWHQCEVAVILRSYWKCSRLETGELPELMFQGLRRHVTFKCQL